MHPVTDRDDPPITPREDTPLKRIVRYTLDPGRLAAGLLVAWLFTYFTFHHQVTDAHFWETYATWPVSCLAWAVITEIHRWAGGRKLSE